MIEKVEVGTLDMGELFEHRGVIYEVLYKTDYCVRCQYPNDKFRYCPLFPIDEQELDKFVTNRLPTLKGKDFKIVF